MSSQRRELPVERSPGTYTPHMTHLAVSIAVDTPDDVDACLARAHAALEAGATMVEWRIDLLAEDPAAAGALVRLVSEGPDACIVTCRPTWEGGAYAGDESTRFSLLEALAVSGERAEFLDIELAAWERSSNLRQKCRIALAPGGSTPGAGTGLILSAHDFDSRPDDLSRRVERMEQAAVCSIMKIAWKANSVLDNLEAFEWQAAGGGRISAQCMGEHGIPSRVLAPKFGGCISYARAEDSPGSATAPGQPSVEELVQRYRFPSITPGTKVYGILGYPVSHSLSPIYHNAGFAGIEHDGVLLPLPVAGGYEEFKVVLSGLLEHPGLDFSGASVTMPHKEHLVRFTREAGGMIDACAEASGAANTLIVDSGTGVQCLDADGRAVVHLLSSSEDHDDATLAGWPVVVVGAGGAARSIVAALLSAGVEVIICNRSRQRAEMLVDTVQAGFLGGSLSTGDIESLAPGSCRAFINCTPVGMAGGPAACTTPLPDPSLLIDEGIVLEMVYNPVDTPLARQARAAGLRLITGKDVFRAQAAIQFQAWTGQEPPAEAGASLDAGNGR